MALLGKPTAILIALSFGMFMYAQLGIRLWTPMFMVREFEDVGVARAAFHSVLWLNGGALVGSLVTARLMERLGARRPSIRLEVSLAGLVLCVVPVLLVAGARTFAGCCVALGAFGLVYGVYEAAHYPAMFDCIVPRYRSACTGITGCWAFLFGSAAPAVLGWMNDHLSMRAGFASLSAFYLAGALILLPAVLVFFRKDRVEQ